jgi:hypothetical protein
VVLQHADWLMLAGLPALLPACLLTAFVDSLQRGLHRVGCVHGLHPHPVTLWCCSKAYPCLLTFLAYCVPALFSLFQWIAFNEAYTERAISVGTIPSLSHLRAAARLTPACLSACRFACLPACFSPASVDRLQRGLHRVGCVNGRHPQPVTDKGTQARPSHTSEAPHT